MKTKRMVAIALGAVTATWVIASEFVLADQWVPELNNNGLTFGVAVEPRYLDDKKYVKQLLGTFNAITPENSGKWERIHPNRNRYDFAGMDRIVDFSVENNLDVRGHTLVWHNQNPGWFTGGRWVKEEAKDIMFDHIDTVVGRYKGKIKRWDVVNEALADNGDMRGTYWYYMFDDDYLKMAFDRAHAADPEAILYYNDYGISDCGDKADGAYQLMSQLVDEGAPVHGIGFQGHYEVSNPVDLHCLNDNINRMGDLGLEVQITELDIRLNIEILDDHLLEKQADQYRKLMGMLATNEHLNGITIWGMSDANSWIPSWFKGQGSALLFDESLEAKPVLDVVKHSLLAFISGKEIFELPARRALTLRSFPVFGAHELTESLTEASIADANVWQIAEVFPLAFNQLNPLRLGVEDPVDIFGQWQAAYFGSSLYGHVIRQDDYTAKTNVGSIWENDCVEVFVKWEGKHYQFRAQVGEDFADIGFPGSAKAIWNDEGSDLFFIIEFPNITELKGETMAWNLALADVDVDGGGREVQLYPVPGSNRSWVGKDLAELHFTGQNRPPSQEARGVVAPVNAMFSESGALPDNPRRIPQMPVSFGVPSIKNYPAVMFTWREQGLTAHTTAPTDLKIIRSKLSLRAPNKVYESAGVDAVELSLDAPLGANLFYRVALEVTVQDEAGKTFVLTAAPLNGYLDIRTQ
jgi:endo-1,4-beta-xylanase